MQNRQAPAGNCILIEIGRENRTTVQCENVVLDSGSVTSRRTSTARNTYRFDETERQKRSPSAARIGNYESATLCASAVAMRQNRCTNDMQEQQQEQTDTTHTLVCRRIASHLATTGAEGRTLRDQAAEFAQHDSNSFSFDEEEVDEESERAGRRG